jgi:hypothetical protein
VFWETEATDRLEPNDQLEADNRYEPKDITSSCQRIATF